MSEYPQIMRKLEFDEKRGVYIKKGLIQRSRHEIEAVINEVSGDQVLLDRLMEWKSRTLSLAESIGSWQHAFGSDRELRNAIVSGTCAAC